MDIDQYDYLWKKGNYDNVLIKGNIGYIIFNRLNNSIMSIENEVLNKLIIEQMLKNGNPIYESINDIKENHAPINVIGEPSEAADFSIRRYKISIQWSKKASSITQIKNLKKAFPSVNDKTNQQLLDIAKNQEQWQFDVLYLDNTRKNNILNVAKEYDLNIIIEPDELKEIF